MSDLPADYPEQINLRAEIARIDRDRAETHKLQGESDKFIAEQRKLIAEGRKFDREPVLAPWLLFTSLLAALSGGIVVAVVSHFWK
jgi:hypothetical protein